MPLVLFPLVVAMLATVAVVCGGRARSAWAAPAAVAGALAVGAALAVAIAGGGGSVDAAWVPDWGWRLHFALDALGGLYAGLAAGIAVPVLVYAWAYVRHHLAENAAPLSRETAFYAWMLAFLLSMLGLAMAGDLVLLFVFFDATALCSWALIGFDREDARARSAALTALLVTITASLCLLAGILLLQARYGTLQIVELAAVARGDPPTVVACALISIAALAKSAQVPLHFWLPRAMVAPTPVSAYLHSAAMVAAGVFVLHRLHAILPEPVLTAIAAVGWASIFAGGALALVATGLKRILAYSTIAHYGHAAVLLGAGGPTAAAAAAVYVAVHAVAKSALFLAAGAVTRATGRSELPEVGGLRRSHPLLAGATTVAAVALAGAPLTAGFFKDEAFFRVVAGGPLAIAAAIGALALTVAYMTRFVSGIFFGDSRGERRPLPRRLVLPVVSLAGLLVAGGLAGGIIGAVGAAAASGVHATETSLELAYHLDLRRSNLFALAGWTIGIVGVGVGRPLAPALAAGIRRAGVLGPAHAWDAGLAGLDALSRRMYRMELRNLRGRVASVFAPAGVLCVIALLAVADDVYFSFGDGIARNLPLATALIATAAATLAVAIVQSHLAMVVLLTGVGFGLAAVFAALGAPDVALVAVLVETGLTLLFVVVLGRLPPRQLDRTEGRSLLRVRARWHAVVAGLSGAVAIGVSWALLSNPGPPTAATKLVQYAPLAHAENVVAAIIADFRALDTLVEVSVLAVAMLGLRALIPRGAAR